MCGKEQTQRFRHKRQISISISWHVPNRWESAEYLWTLCLGRWIQAPLPAEPLRVFHGNDWWSSWSPRRRAKRSTCTSPVGCGKAPLCSSIKLPPPYLCTAEGKTRTLIVKSRNATPVLLVLLVWYSGFPVQEKWLLNNFKYMFTLTLGTTQTHLI